jgi:hypothetical protein
MVSDANRLTAAASRMVKLIRANGIYSSPIVKTILIKAWLRKKLILPGVTSGAADPKYIPTQALIRKGAVEGSGKAGRSSPSRALGLGTANVLTPDSAQNAQDGDRVSVETV